MKLDKTPEEDKIILKASKDLLKIREEEFVLRKTLFNFLRKNLKYVEKVDFGAHKKLIQNLTNVQMSDLTQEVIIWKEAKKEVCKDCIIIVNCSENCEKLKEKYNNLHQKHSKELWNGQKGKV